MLAGNFVDACGSTPVVCSSRSNPKPDDDLTFVVERPTLTVIMEVEIPAAPLLEFQPSAVETGSWRRETGSRGRGWKKQIEA
jgi:hypothetical protein